MQPLLVELSRRTGQAGEMEWLDYFLASPDSLAKTPYLLLIGQAPGGDLPPENTTARDLMGAVLLYEYRFAGQGTRVFATDNVNGIRTVLAPEHLRLQVAHLAVRRLMTLGAVTTLISLDGRFDALAEAPHRTRPGWWTATRTRVTPRYLELADTLDRTLQKLGHNTRRNLRRYRHKVEVDLGAQFVPSVEMSLDQFLQMNRLSRNPAPEPVVRWRYSLLQQTGPGDAIAFSGLRAADGRWLSLIGGRRHGNTLELDWQMNLARLPQYSLCTAMRSYLLEYEIARGTRRLIFEGGTPHPLRLSFASRETTDILAVRRESARAWALRRFSRWIFPEKNFLAQTLRELPAGTASKSQLPSRFADAA
jgi:hypothetical protein